MIITAYYPMIYVNDLNAALKQYCEELGFERLHTLDAGVIKLHVLAVNGYRLDIFTSSIEEMKGNREGFYAMRVNVREFDEAIAYYEKKGYKMQREPFRGTSAIHTVMMNDEGERLFVFHHIRKDH